MTLILIAFAAGVVLSPPVRWVLSWLWHEGGVGCALLDHDPNLASLSYSERGICWRCRGPLLPAAPTPSTETNDG